MTSFSLAQVSVEEKKLLGQENSKFLPCSLSLGHICSPDPMALSSLESLGPVWPATGDGAK